MANRWNLEEHSHTGKRGRQLVSGLTVFGMMLSVAAGSQALADDAAQGGAPPAQSAPSPAGGANAPDQPGAALQGGVRTIELNLEVIRDFGLDLKKLLRASTDLYDEVTIQPVSLVTQPEIIGPGTIIYIPVATQPTGAYVPPRQKRVDLAMGAMRPLVALMKQDADLAVAGQLQVEYPGDTKEELQPILKAWVGDMQDISNHFAKLESLTTAPPYDNAAIATEVGSLHDETKQIDKSRRKVFKVLQKEGKRQQKKPASK